LHPHGPHQIFHSPRRNPLHVRLLYHSAQRPHRPAPRHERAREGTPIAHSPNLRLEGPDPRVSLPFTVAVPLPPARLDSARSARFFSVFRPPPPLASGSGASPPLAQEVRVLTRLRLARELAQCHPRRIGHRRRP